jgi:hypothetical protein
MTYEPNDYQVAGNHYQTKDKYQLWDLITDINLNFLLANAIKYIYRCKNKNGLQDLEKAKHYIDKFFSLSLDKQINLLTISLNKNVNMGELINNFLNKEINLSVNQHSLIRFILCVHGLIYNEYPVNNIPYQIHFYKKYIEESIEKEKLKYGSYNQQC